MAIICHCNVVRDRAIVKAIHRGADTLDEIRAVCNAATRCGGCEDAVADLLDRHCPAYAPHGVQVAFGA